MVRKNSVCNDTVDATGYSLDGTGDAAADKVDDITEVISDKQEAWHYATDDTNSDEIRNIQACIPVSLPQPPLDNNIICDIQCIVSRLVAKASQLIGTYNKYTCDFILHILFQQVILPSILLSFGYTFAQSLMVVNKITEFKEEPSRDVAQEQDYSET